MRFQCSNRNITHMGWTHDWLYYLFCLLCHPLTCGFFTQKSSDDFFKASCWTNSRITGNLTNHSELSFHWINLGDLRNFIAMHVLTKGSLSSNIKRYCSYLQQRRSRVHFINEFSLISRIRSEIVSLYFDYSDPYNFPHVAVMSWANIAWYSIEYRL